MKLWKYVSVFVLLAFIPSLIYMVGVIVDMYGGGAVILWGTRVALTTVFTIIIGLTYYLFYYPFASYIKSYIRNNVKFMGAFAASWAMYIIITIINIYLFMSLNFVGVLLCLLAVTILGFITYRTLNVLRVGGFSIGLIILLMLPPLFFIMLLVAGKLPFALHLILAAIVYLLQTLAFWVVAQPVHVFAELMRSFDKPGVTLVLIGSTIAALVAVMAYYMNLIFSVYLVFIDAYRVLLVVGFAQIFILGVFSAYVVFVENILTENKTQR